MPFKTGTREGYPGGDDPSVFSIRNKIRDVKSDTGDAASKNKNGASQVLDDNTPSSDVRNVPASTPDRSVAQPDGKVKERFSVDDSDQDYDALDAEFQAPQRQAKERKCLPEPER